MSKRCLSGLLLFALVIHAPELADGPVFAFYGDVQMDKTSKQYGFPPVTFPHWFHRIEFTCQVCHPGIFKMERGGRHILMERMTARENFCSTCHNGEIAWNPVNCMRCHRVKGEDTVLQGRGLARLPEPGPPFAKANADPLVLLRNFPRDSGGNIDWIASVRMGIIAPRTALKWSGAHEMLQQADIVMPHTGDMPEVIFPHSSHALWLSCKNCHADLFVPKRGANPIDMRAINSGNYCGKCHGRVAFPISECNRCHLQ